MSRSWVNGRRCGTGSVRSAGVVCLALDSFQGAFLTDSFVPCKVRHLCAEIRKLWIVDPWKHKARIDGVQDSHVDLARTADAEANFKSRLSGVASLLRV